MTKVSRTYRLDSDLVSRLEAEAARRGQSHTTFVTRAVESALATGEHMERQAVLRADGEELRAQAIATGKRLNSVPVILSAAQEAKVLARRGGAHHPKCACGVCKPSRS